MPTPTYTPLATVTLGTAVSSVTFSSIPATYRDLILVSETSHSSTTEIKLHPNGNGTGSHVKMFGNGSSATSDTASRIEIAYLASTGVAVTQVMDYSATDKHKTILSRWGYASGFVGANAARWENTSAITSLDVLISTGTFPAGSTFSLYGVIA